MDPHVAVDPEPLLRFFQYDHLKSPLREVSHACGDLAVHLVRMVPRSAERTVALRKLLEAKDAAVRAMLDAPKDA